MAIVLRKKDEDTWDIMVDSECRGICHVDEDGRYVATVFVNFGVVGEPNHSPSLAISNAIAQAAKNVLEASISLNPILAIGGIDLERGGPQQLQVEFEIDTPI